LALHPARKVKEQPTSQQRNSVLVGFMVSDLEAKVEQLQKKKVKFLKNEGRVLWLARNNRRS
jgi:hypothetical protein